MILQIVLSFLAIALTVACVLGARMKFVRRFFLLGEEIVVPLTGRTVLWRVFCVAGAVIFFLLTLESFGVNIWT